MFEGYDAKPWLRIGVGYVYGRLTRNAWDMGDGKPPHRIYLKKFLADEGGFAECLCCPEIGYKQFRRRHTLAKFLREHRNCGKAVIRSPRTVLAQREVSRGRQSQSRVSGKRPRIAD